MGCTRVRSAGGLGGSGLSLEGSGGSWRLRRTTAGAMCQDGARLHWPRCGQLLWVDAPVRALDRVDAGSLSPQGMYERCLEAVARRHTPPSGRCTATPLPFSPPTPPSPPSWALLSPHPALSRIHGQEGPRRNGPVCASWQRQRLAAPAASTVSLRFLSGAEGLGRAVHTRTDSLQALERGVVGWGRCHLSSTIGASLTSHGSFLQEPWMCLGRVVENAWWGGGADIWRTSGRATRGPVAAEAAVRAWVCEAGGSAWTWFGCFLAFQGCGLEHRVPRPPLRS